MLCSSMFRLTIVCVGYILYLGEICVITKVFHECGNALFTEISI